MREGNAPRWVPFIYREFYDVPRMIVFEESGHWYLLDGSFDENLDEYPPDYQVFELPGAIVSNLPTNWGDLPALALRRLGVVAVTSVRLDETRRKQLDGSVLGNVRP